MELMTRLDKHFTLIACVAAMMLVGCADSSGPRKPDAARLTLSSLGDTRTTGIDPADRPDPPTGFTDKDMDVLAALMTDVAKASFSRRILEVKDVDDKFDRVLSPLKASYPETVSGILEAGDKKYESHPWKRIFVDPFPRGLEPRRPAKILRVAWEAEGGEDSGDRFVTLRLQVHAAYEVGTKAEPRIIGVRRTIELDSFGLEYVPGLGGESVTYGTDECVSAIDGEYVWTTDKTSIDEDRRALKTSLASKSVGSGSGSVAELENVISKCRMKDDGQRH